jgi:hypothetical protein
MSFDYFFLLQSNRIGTFFLIFINPYFLPALFMQKMKDMLRQAQQPSKKIKVRLL